MMGISVSPRTDFGAHFLDLARRHREAAHDARDPDQRCQQLKFAREYIAAAARLRDTSSPR